MKFPSSVPPIDDNRIRELWLSAFIFPTLSTCDELGLFDILAKNDLDQITISKTLGLSETTIGVLITTLRALGLLVEKNGVFQLTDLSKYYLVHSSPFYWGHMFKWFRELPLSHERMLNALQGFGTKVSDVWESANVTPDHAEFIAAAMNSHSMTIAVGLAGKINLSGIRSVLDVGGGSGCFSLAMAQSNPHVKFDIADLPSVCLCTRKNIENFNMSNQIGTVVLDMFVNDWPRTYDAIFFANVLHDWNEAQCLHLMKNSFTALPPGGEILIFEMLINAEGDGPLVAGLFSMSMLLNTKGKQFNALELKALLEETGFSNVITQDVISNFVLVRAQKPT